MSDVSGRSATGSVGLLSIAVTVEDLDRAVAWWEDVFGAEVLARSRFEQINARVAMVQAPGFKLELLEIEGGYRVPEMFAEPPAHVHPIGGKAIVLETDDLVGLTSELEAKHVTIVWSGVELGDMGPTTAIRDSEGNFMTIFERGALTRG
jgi:catechol 2,3-dioxygenase-like lactoylglutathione lyase family enzyme